MTMRWRCHPASGELRAGKDRPRFFTGRVPLPNTEGPVMSLTGVEEVLQKCAKIEKLFFFPSGVGETPVLTLLVPGRVEVSPPTLEQAIRGHLLGVCLEVVSDPTG